jgi:GDSL-like Lipase/Acylhydrolase family
MRERIILSTASLLLAAACGPGGRGPGDHDVDAGGQPAVDASPVGQHAPITPANPLVSRGRPVSSSEGDTSQAGPITTIDDGAYWANDGFQAAVTADHAPWIAIDVGAGPSRLLLSFLGEGEVADQLSHTPIDYRVEVSPDGQAWKTVVTVTGNDTNAREHAFDFTGQARVRIVFDRADGGVVHLFEIEAFDVSHGSEDTWMFVGDSVTAMAMNHWATPDFATRVHDGKPAAWPLVIDEAIGGTQTLSATTADDSGVAPIDRWIARFPDVRNVVVAYGTNDAGCDLTGDGVAPYIARLRTIIDKLKGAGKRVIVPHIPWNHWGTCAGPTLLAPYNAAIDALRAEDDFVAGPDLYTYFAAHQGDLYDGVHPDGATGIPAMNDLWSQAVMPLYP